MSIHPLYINADLGEGLTTDALIIPYIHAANIACGYHAGDIETIQRTIELCSKHNVAVGAHPSYFDRDNFGRTEKSMDQDELYDLVIQQLIIFKEIADVYNLPLNHIKPHGALYNQSARDPLIAETIARAVKDFDHSTILFGLSGSHSISVAKDLGLRTASEVFADRTYQEDGSLTPRSQANAMIEDNEKALRQVMQMLNEGLVMTTSGKLIPIVAETVCVHGDGANALRLVRALDKKLNR